MRARDLDLKELLQFDPDGGTLRFANERVLLLDALALGPLRRELDSRRWAWPARAPSSRGLATPMADR